ncbi:hypothetical protein [Wenyingzhuangia sp. IMCC45574]
MSIRCYFLLMYCFFSTQWFYSQNHDINTLLNKGIKYKYSQPNLAIRSLTECYQHSIHQKDTLIAIESLMQLANIYSHNVNYTKAYDNYWKALLLAENQKDQLQKARINQELGWLYSFYHRDNEALKHFSYSLKISKDLYAKKEAPIEYVSSDYFSFTNFYRRRGNLPMFEKYLDSLMYSQSISDVKGKNYYMEGEFAYHLASKHQFKKALHKLDSVKQFFEQYDKSYLVVVYHLLGDTYKKMKDYKKSEEAFLYSIELSKKSSSHANYNIMSYECLVELSKWQNNYKKAFEYLKLSKTLNDSVFGSRSTSNHDLFELKDSYRITKEKEKIEKQEQRLKELEQEDYIWFLKYVILISSIAFLLIFGFLFFRQLRMKHATEKKLIEEKQKLELKRKNEVLELKNKELTAQALQLIEKEEFLSHLNQKLSKQKDTIDVKTISRMVKSVQSSPTSNWKEFEARFTQINQSFYKNLKEQFPNLGQTDQKICALIKLNFSSKEMSSLLGISVESVHTSRYRLRKKLGLNRNDSLSKFINSI